jgi:hypothetical protein
MPFRDDRDSLSYAIMYGGNPAKNFELLSLVETGLLLSL